MTQTQDTAAPDAAAPGSVASDTAAQSTRDASATPSGTHATVPSSHPDATTTLDFYALSRPVQDRFLASASGSGVPDVVLFQAATQTRALGWLVLAVSAPVIAITLLALGFGDLKHDFALQPVPMVVAQAALFGALAVSLVGYSLARSRSTRFPFRLGTYLFPAGVVVADGPIFETHTLSSLVGLSIDRGVVTLRFPSRTFRFRLPKETDEGEFEKWVQTSQQAYSEAMASHNRRELAVLDPLRDSGFSNPLSSSEPHQRPKDRRVLRFAAAAVLGVLIGSLLFFARNKLGERIIYKAAVEANTTGAFRAYLARGGKRSDVEATLLPIAELAEARGSLEAVEKYSEQNPDSVIRPQIDAALREEMLAALDAVRQKGTLQAVADFEAAHPKHEFVAAELAAARTAVYSAAIKRYQETSAAGPRVQAFFVDLMKFSKKHGPKVEVRFRLDLPDATEQADSSIRKSAYYTGPSSLPSQYFQRQHSEPRENDAAKRIIDGLQSQFSSEVLQFVQGERIEGGDALPSVEHPTLFVTHRPVLSGGYTTKAPRGVYVGVGFMVFTSFVIPDHDKPLNIKKQSWWLPPDVTQIWRDELTPAQVYDDRAREGFNRYVDKLLSILDPKVPSEGEGDVQDGETE